MDPQWLLDVQVATVANSTFSNHHLARGLQHFHLEMDLPSNYPCLGHLRAGLLLSALHEATCKDHLETSAST